MPKGIKLTDQVRKNAQKLGIQTYESVKPCQKCNTRQKKTSTAECLRCRELAIAQVEKQKREAKIISERYLKWQRERIDISKQQRKEEMAARKYIPLSSLLPLLDWRKAMDNQMGDGDVLLRPRVNYGADNSYPDEPPFNLTHRAPLHSNHRQGIVQDLTIW